MDNFKLVITSLSVNNLNLSNSIKVNDSSLILKHSVAVRKALDHVNDYKVDLGSSVSSEQVHFICMESLMLLKISSIRLAQSLKVI